MDYVSIIADDLTGASDTGVQFCKCGLKTKVIVDSNYLNHYIKEKAILSVNSETRSLTGNEAYNRVASITQELKNAGYKRIYKKIDSTLRGNAGAELEAVMDVLELDLAIVIPAFPANGRKVINGDLIVVAPVEKKICHIPTVLQSDTKRKVGYINLDTIQQGVASIIIEIESLQKKGYQVIVFDTVSEKDLSVIAKVCKVLSKDFVLAGAAGLAAYLPEVWGLSIPNIDRTLTQDGITLLVAGTCNSITGIQINELVQTTMGLVVPINTKNILEGKEDQEILRIVSTVIKLFEAQPDSKLIVIAVDTLLDGKPIEYSSSNLAIQGKKIANIIGEIVSKLMFYITVKNLVITGGDTAYNVIHALGAIGIELEDEIIPGIPLGRLLGGKADGMTIITKAGGFGPTEALVQVMGYLENRLK